MSRSGSTGSADSARSRRWADVVVMSPHQNNFEMPLRWRIRLWPTHERIAPRRLKRWARSADTSVDPVQATRAARRRAKQRPKRLFDTADPVRRNLIERTERFKSTPISNYGDVHVDHESDVLDVRTMFQVVSSQLMLVLAGPDIDSIDPHGYLRRTRASIAEVLPHVPDQRAEPLRQLDALIEDTLSFEATDRARARGPRFAWVARA
jgi:hypothetical protein